jgi:hypothetical protein
MPNCAESICYQRDAREYDTLSACWVATTRGRQMGTDNNQLRQWRACCRVGKAAAAQRPHGSVVGVRGGRGHAAVLVGRWQGIGGGEG